LVVATGVDVCWTDDWLDVDKDKLELLSDNESGSRLRFSASDIYAYRYITYIHQVKTMTSTNNKPQTDFFYKNKKIS